MSRRSSALQDLDEESKQSGGGGLLSKLRNSLGRSSVPRTSVARGSSKESNEKMAKKAAKEAEGNKGEWVQIQKKTFTRWMNSYLEKNNQVEDLATDLKDGTKLAALLERISDKDVGKINKNPKMDLHKLENLNKCMEFIKKHDIPLVNVGSSDILKENEKIILGLIWMIILRWEVQQGGKNGQGGKEGLLLWAQRACKPSGINVTNFSSSWQDGLAFNALIHKHRPDLVNMDKLDAGNAMENLNNAFGIAENDLGIARLLDAEDIVKSPDEKSIVAYVSQFFKKFAGDIKKSSNLRAVQTAVEVTQRHDKWISEYNTSSNKLMAFVRQQKEKMCGSGAELPTTDDVSKALDDFDEYMKKTKPEHEGERSKCNGVYSMLVSSKTNNRRPSFDTAIIPDEITAEWEQLGTAEESYERRMLDRYMAYQAADKAIAKFTPKANNLSTWLAEKRAVFMAGNLGESTPEIEANLEMHRQYENRLVLYKKMHQSMKDTVSAAQQADGHVGAKACADEHIALGNEMQEVEALGKQHRVKLEDALKRFRTLEGKQRDYLRQLDNLDFTLDALDEVVAEGDSGGSADEIKAAGKNVDEAGKLIVVLIPVAQELQAIIPDAPKRVAEQQDRLDQIESKMQSRLRELEKNATNDAKKDALCKEFAEKANALASFCGKQQKQLGKLSGGPSDQLAQLSKLRADIAGDHSKGAGLLADVSASHEACEDAGVVANRHTKHTIYSIKALYLHLVNSAKDAEDALQAQLMSSSFEVSPDQLAEIQEIFATFDTDKDGKIKLKELQQACQAAGMDLSDSEVENGMKERNPEMEFSVGDFTGFFIDQFKTGDTKEDVLAAFGQIAKDGRIPADQVDVHFVPLSQDLADYLKANMKNGDFKTFADEIFSR